MTAGRDGRDRHGDGTAAGAEAPDTAAHESAPAASDAAARRRAESDERYQALVRATGHIVWTSTADGRLVDADAWRAYTGQSAEDLGARRRRGHVPARCWSSTRPTCATRAPA